MNDSHDKTMNLWDHVEELRWTLLRCLITLIVTTSAGFMLTSRLSEVLQLPLKAMSIPVTIIFTGPMEAFLARLKLALVAGIAAALPVLVYFIWSFVKPALRGPERRAVWAALLSGTVFFAIGACLGYVVLFFGLSALVAMGLPGGQQMWTLANYLGFCVRFILVFGLIFEMPVVLVALAWIGLVKAATLAKGRRYAIVVIAVVAAILTPPDPFTMIVLTVPLVALYEVSIIVARILQDRGKRRASDDADALEGQGN